MRSIIFFLLSVCYAVSSQKVKVHVQAVSDYETLEFKPSTGQAKSFKLGTTTTATDVAVTNEGNISQESLDIGFDPKSASILAVNKVAIQIPWDATCAPADAGDSTRTGDSAGKNCIGAKPLDPTKFIVHAVAVNKKQTKMNCTVGGTDVEFTLVHAAAGAAAAADPVQVDENGAINGAEITLASQPQKCEIEAFDKSAIEITKTTTGDCTAAKAPCFQVLADGSGSGSTTAAASDNIFRLAVLVTCAILGIMF